MGLNTCETRHYVREDALKQVVMLELHQMAQMVMDNEEAFAEALSEKTNADMIKEQKSAQSEIQRAAARCEKVRDLHEQLYEKNVDGKVTDEWFMQLSHKYEVERFELKNKISELQKQLTELDGIRQGKENFIAAVRKFMQMEKLTAPLLRELIDRIDVYETEGTGKNRTQRIVIHYRFVGYIDLAQSITEENYRVQPRKGVEVEYLSKQLPA